MRDDSTNLDRKSATIYTVNKMIGGKNKSHLFTSYFRRMQGETATQFQSNFWNHVGIHASKTHRLRNLNETK